MIETDDYTLFIKVHMTLRYMLHFIQLYLLVQGAMKASYFFWMLRVLCLICCFDSNQGHRGYLFLYIHEINNNEEAFY